MPPSFLLNYWRFAIPAMIVDTCAYVYQIGTKKNIIIQIYFIPKEKITEAMSLFGLHACLRFHVQVFFIQKWLGQ
jgi:hypothetical protein